MRVEINGLSVEDEATFFFPFSVVDTFRFCLDAMGNVIRWEELTVFGILVRVLRLCLQNVAVSKSHHRLFFYPNKGKGEKNMKDL